MWRLLCHKHNTHRHNTTFTLSIDELTTSAAPPWWWVVPFLKGIGRAQKGSASSYPCNTHTHTQFRRCLVTAHRQPGVYFLRLTLYALPSVFLSATNGQVCTRRHPRRRWATFRQPPLSLSLSLLHCTKPQETLTRITYFSAPTLCSASVVVLPALSFPYLASWLAARPFILPLSLFFPPMLLLVCVCVLM